MTKVGAWALTRWQAIAARSAGRVSDRRSFRQPLGAVNGMGGVHPHPRQG